MFIATVHGVHGIKLQQKQSHKSDNKSITEVRKVVPWWTLLLALITGGLVGAFMVALYVAGESEAE